MVEKILFLITNEERVSESRALLKGFGVDVVDMLAGKNNVPFGELDARYNIIIVETLFCGNSRETAALVRRIRQEFYNPIIGVETLMTGSGTLPLQVAGCNFIVPQYHLGFDYTSSQEARWASIQQELCDIISRISMELDGEHHRRLAA